MALSQTSVIKLYSSVIDDVIACVRESWLDEGVDEQVLAELKQIWETKLLSSKSIEMAVEPDPVPPLTHKEMNRIQQKPVVVNSGVQLAQQQQHHQPQQQLSMGNNSSAPPPQPQPVQLQDFSNKQIPIQITLPSQPGSTESQPRVLTIQVPASALQGNQLHTVLTGPVLSATMALPLHLASSLLQQHVTAALQGQQAANLASQMQATASNNLIQQQHNITNNSLPVRQIFQHHQQSGDTVSQLDGPNDTSDDEDEEEEEEEEDNDDDADDKEDDENDENEGGAEEEPLNSEDDVSEEDPSELFDTDNVVVCQYDKITRSRNKWKFYLKDGIMNLSGKDFVFQKANGDAEW